MIDNYDEIPEAEALSLIRPAQRFQKFEVIDLEHPMSPSLFVGGKSFSPGHKHWVIEFKTSGAIKGKGNESQNLVEIFLKEIDPSVPSLKKFEAEEFHVYVDPECPIQYYASKINNFGNSYVNGKETIKKIAPKIAEKIRNSVLYTRNFGLLHSVVGRQMEKEGFPSLEKLTHDIVDVKAVAIRLKLTRTNAIEEVWSSLGIHSNPKESRSEILAEVMCEGLSRMRFMTSSKLQISPNHVADTQASLPFTPTEITTMNNPEEGNPKLPQPLDSVEKDATVAIKSPQKRANNRSEIPDEARAVCVRNLTKKQLAFAKSLHAEGPIVYISARGRHVKMEDGRCLTIFQKDFGPGPGTQKTANEYRDALVLLYDMAGYSRLTEGSTPIMAPGQLRRMQKPKAADVRIIHRRFELVLNMLRDVPLDLSVKIKVLDDLAKRMKNPLESGYELGENSSLMMSLENLRAEFSSENVTSFDEILTDEIEIQSIVPPVKDQTQVDGVPHSETQGETRVVKPEAPLAEVSPPIAHSKAAENKASIPSILNTPYIVLCAKTRDVEDIIQDLRNESTMAREQAAVLIAHANKKEQAAKTLENASNIV